MCCSPWGLKELDISERLNWLNWKEQFWVCDCSADNGIISELTKWNYSLSHIHNIKSSLIFFLIEILFPLWEKLLTLGFSSWMNWEVGRYFYNFSSLEFRWELLVVSDIWGGFAVIVGFPWWLSDKESDCQYRRQGFHLWVGKMR